MFMSMTQLAAIVPPLMPDVDFKLLFMAWAQTIGWAVVGGLGMGLGLVISLKVFTLLTKDVDEWAEVKKNNLGMSIILASVILGTSLVIMMCAKP
jgi:uncharacterized membrane protein YjfL (UPF0719 family)